MLVLSSVNLAKKGLITYLTQESTHYCLCVFVSYSYNASVNFTEGRCPGSKAMFFDECSSCCQHVTVPNVNIGDCDYTIAFWIRLSPDYQFAQILGSPRGWNFLLLNIYAYYAQVCRKESARRSAICLETSPVAPMNNWTHIAVTCEQDNNIKIFINGEPSKVLDSYLVHFFGDNTMYPKQTFLVGYSYCPVIMDLHIFGFALPREEIYNLYRG